MKKGYGRGALVTDVVRNGSPVAGGYLLGAACLVVVVLAFGDFGGREFVTLFAHGNTSPDMLADRIMGHAGQGGAASCSQLSELKATRSGYVLECRYDAPHEDGAQFLKVVFIDLDRFGNVIGIRPLK
jgi:hypothetical protein